MTRYQTNDPQVQSADDVSTKFMNHLEVSSDRRDIESISATFKVFADDIVVISKNATTYLVMFKDLSTIALSNKEDPSHPNAYGLMRLPSAAVEKILDQLIHKDALRMEDVAEAFKKGSTKQLVADALLEWVSSAETEWVNEAEVPRNV